MPITGDVLRWALADAGVTPGQLAELVGVPASVVDEWVGEDSFPSMTQFRAIARELRRPESFFFLPRPPQEKPAAAEFRKHASWEGGEPGSDTADGLRQARIIQKVAVWSHDKLDLDPVRVPNLETSVSPAIAANRLREWLDWSLSYQTDPDTSDTKVSQRIREHLQDHGLLVLNLTLDEHIVRGFSLASTTVPLIAVNTRDHQRARIFSYIHELAHLAINSESVCLTRENEGIERWCNQVAAAFLMPEADFRRHVRSKYGQRKISTVQEVSALRNRYNVSLRAVAVRLENLDLATPGLYRRVNKEAELKRRGGVYDPDRVQNKPRVRLRQFGRTYINTLTEAEEAGALGEAQVLELLRLSPSELRTIRTLAASGVEG